MGKYKASFSVGWMHIDAEEDSLWDLVSAIEREQDLQCLAMMAGQMGTKKDKQEIRKLLEFLSKRSNDELTVEDIRNLDINLSVGRIKCDELIELE